ncbi:ABC transporter substrate-binding protein [Pseudooceanicola spongiae]|uniref:Probable sugar-binding periplasmic protein n=1 Tax=Pseudooceanicola spongiae TaxID=2613965 RepID=A0A7L9WLZ2_9RHOB|nr:ABC transporter substrate-binding protein [Pseudooceanicola spongiae]QOL80737.1 extracellular solute-binding protein [Pseudooceanicola spongiae]
MKLKSIFAATTAVTFIALPVLAEPQAEVLHWWTSGGEAKSVAVLQEEFAARGGKWTDMPVAGGGGDAAMTALRARVLSGNAPTAVQLKGPAIQEWYEEGVLADISDVAEAQHWGDVLPAQLAEHMKCDGHWCAAPVNVHRVNWLWGNAEILAQNGIEMPTTWEEFNAAADKLKAAGITPLAHGGQSWQDATVFETVVLAQGAEFYQAALVDLDEDALSSDTMIKVFDEMRTLRGYVDDNFSGRDWNLATAMVMNGEAAFQIMGDWAKGEFLAAGKEPGKDFLCAATPGHGFLYNVDSFAMFDVSGDEDKVEGQNLLAELIVGPSFQETFNLNKGSIPVRTDVSLDKFDSCAVKSSEDMQADAKDGSLLPSYAHGMALHGEAAGAITDVVTAHFNSDMSSEEAVKILSEAVANAM